MIIAFDCFDTLVIRDCHPEQVIYIWAKRMNLLLSLQSAPLDLYELRKKVENSKRAELCKDEISYRELIIEIYTQLASQNKLVISAEDFFQLSIDLEVEIELQHITLTDSAMKKLMGYRDEGNHIVLISDFYLGNIFFEKMLSHLQIRQYFEKLYISSELGFRKSTGKLYEYVLKDLQIEPNQLLMIGDNPVSDVEIPRKIGIKTKPVGKQEICAKITKAKLQRTLSQLFRCSKEEMLFNGYVPALLLFIDRLYKQAVFEKCTDLLFCSREGQNLKMLFDIYQSKVVGKKVIQTHYFYVSRKSTLQPSLKDINEEDFSRIFRQYNAITLHDFLYNIGFVEEEITRLCNEEKIDKEMVVTKEAIESNKKTIFSKSLFLEMYNAKRNMQKELLINYINGLVDADSNILYLVDIGWKGTIQDSIFEVIRGKKAVQGYYFGLSQKIERDNNRKKGIMFDCESVSEHYNIFSYNCIELERVFAANHGQTLTYEERNGRVEPILSMDPSDIEIYDYVEKWQKTMNKTFTDAIELFNSTPYLPEDISVFLTKMYLRHLCCYEPKYYHVYLNFRKKYKENFGNVTGKNNVNEAEIIKDHAMKKRYGYVDYIYRILNKCHIGFLEPIANIYCVSVYIIKSKRLKRTRS